jgi:PHP family Zn ribbon phosphoesterase
MQIISDLHIHSRFSRACSKEITIDNLEKYARIKGVNLLGTGDFQHPKWIKELKSKLTEDDKGILRTKTGFPFVWQTEISLMYTKNNKGRKIHHVILAPDGEVVKQITDALLKKGRIDYDGRPIFGFTSEELVDMLISISDKCMIIPAHTWTPYFGIFGSMSGFDSVE